MSHGERYLLAYGAALTQTSNGLVLTDFREALDVLRLIIHQPEIPRRPVRLRDAHSEESLKQILESEY